MNEPTWATVTATDPLRIRFDGDSAALPVTPGTLIGGLSVGRRVLTVMANRQPIVVGSSVGAAGNPIDIVPTSGWGTATAATRAFPQLVAVGSMVILIAGSIELKAGSVAFNAGSDVQIGTFPDLAPPAEVCLPCVLHFASGTPTFGRVTVSPAGAVAARSSQTATMPAGTASLVMVPSASWKRTGAV